ncbi:MAG: mechanosensitive ion channel [Anaerolineales bacterium]|nr:mechanosensitive ion channel [Anaerolineales bacterium]
MLQKELLEKIRAEQTLKHKDDILKLTNKFIDTITLDAERLRQEWIEKIRAGQALKEEDDILKLIDDSVVNSKLSKADILRGQKVTAAYKRLMIRCRNVTPKEIPWLQISNLFYKLALTCRQRRGKDVEKRWGEWELSVREQYQKLRLIIRQDTNDDTYSAITVPALFLIIFSNINLLWRSIGGDTLGKELAFWGAPILWIGAAFFAQGVISVSIGSFAQWVTEKTWTDFEGVIVNVITGLLSVISTAIFLLLALDILTGPASAPLEFGPFLTWITYEATANILRTLVVIFVGTWSIALIVNRSIAYLLTNWASTNRQSIDEVVIRIIQLIATSSAVAIGIVVTLTIIQDPIKQAIGTDLTTLLSIFVTIIVAIVGYASRFMFENLLSGVSLQIEKPFEIGDRIKLPDGQLCEVVALGLRRTLLRSVDDSSKIAIPNSELARWSIKNTSRMDSSRINNHVWIADPAQVGLAQEILLDIAYLEREIDQMRVFEAELTLSERDKLRENLFLSSYRITLEEGLERLVKRHIKIRKTIVSKIIRGGVSEPEPVFDVDGNTEKDPWRKVLNRIADSWRNYSNALKDEDERLLRCVRDLEGDQANEILRNYRRAINEVVFSERKSSPDDLSAMLREVALHERIVPVEKLYSVLLLLSESKSSKFNIDQRILDKIRGRLKEFESERLGIVFTISENIAILENYIYAIGEQYPDVRSELDGIIGELAREPSISSEYSDDGHVRLTLSCYALYLERRLEIQHKINREIGQRFRSAGIIFDRSVQKAVS